MKFVPMLSLVVGLSFGAYAPVIMAETPKKEVSKADKAKAKKLATAGEKAAKGGDYQKALVSYQDAYNLSPEVEYLAAIGDCYTALTRYKDALDSYNNYLKEAGFGHPLRAEVEKKVTDTKTSLANAAKTNGDLAYNAGKDYQKALSLYQESYDISQDPVLLYKMGMCHAKMNNYKEGIDTLSSFLAKAPANDPNRTDADQQIAMLQESAASAAFSSGKYDDAVSIYRMLYARDAQPKRLVELGRCYQKMGKTEDANNAFRTFLAKADPNDPLRAEVEAQLPKETNNTNTANKDGENKGRNKNPDTTNNTDTGGSATPKVFFGVAGVSLALGATAGTLAFLSTQRLNELTDLSAASEFDPDQIALHQTRRAMLAPAADILIGAAVVTGVLGFVTRDKGKGDPQASTTLTVSPNGAVLLVQF